MNALNKEQSPERKKAYKTEKEMRPMAKTNKFLKENIDRDKPVKKTIGPNAFFMN